MILYKIAHFVYKIVYKNSSKDDRGIPTIAWKGDSLLRNKSLTTEIINTSCMAKTCLTEQH